VRNRTFFFATYEGLRQRQGIDINSGVLSDAERAAVTDPVTRQLLQFIPNANATVNGAARFVGSEVAPVNIDQWTGGQPDGRRERPAARLLRVPEGSAPRADAAAQHDSRLRRHAPLVSPDWDAE
jgi:flagellin-like hook-associated protein FlgL